VAILITGLFNWTKSGAVIDRYLSASYFLYPGQ